MEENAMKLLLVEDNTELAHWIVNLLRQQKADGAWFDRGQG